MITKRNTFKAGTLVALLASAACAPLPTDPKLAREVGESLGGLGGAVAGAAIGNALEDSGLGTGIGAATGTIYGRQLGGAYAEAQARQAGACRESRTQTTDYLAGQRTSDTGVNNCTIDTAYPQ